MAVIWVLVNFLTYFFSDNPLQKIWTDLGSGRTFSSWYSSFFQFLFHSASFLSLISFTSSNEVTSSIFICNHSTTVYVSALGCWWSRNVVWCSLHIASNLCWARRSVLFPHQTQCLAYYYSVMYIRCKLWWHHVTLVILLGRFHDMGTAILLSLTKWSLQYLHTTWCLKRAI